MSENHQEEITRLRSLLDIESLRFYHNLSFCDPPSHHEEGVENLEDCAACIEKFLEVASAETKLHRKPKEETDQKCDCQNPPPHEGAEGTFQVSEQCPVHNDYPLIPPAWWGVPPGLKETAEQEPESDQPMMMQSVRGALKNGIWREHANGSLVGALTKDGKVLTQDEVFNMLCDLLASDVEVIPYGTFDPPKPPAKLEDRERANLLAAIKELQDERDDLRRKLTMHRDKAEGNYWAWQGEDDHLKSLSCPVLISASDLRALIEPGERRTMYAVVLKGSPVSDAAALFDDVTHAETHTEFMSGDPDYDGAYEVITVWVRDSGITAQGGE